MKQGKKFGFLKFKEVKNTEELLAKIKSVTIGADHLLVKEARFKRTERNQPNPTIHEVAAPLMAGTSKHAWKWVHQHQDPNPTKVEAPPHPPLIEWLTNCAFAEVRNSHLLPKLDGLLQGAGFLLSSVKYLCGLWVLLECTSPEAAEQLVSDAKNHLKE